MQCSPGGLNLSEMNHLDLGWYFYLWTSLCLHNNFYYLSEIWERFWLYSTVLRSYLQLVLLVALRTCGWYHALHWQHIFTILRSYTRSLCVVSLSVQSLEIRFLSSYSAHQIFFYKSWLHETLTQGINLPWVNFSIQV